MCIMAHMSKRLKHILGTIAVASIAGATIQPVALAQITEPIRIEPIPSTSIKRRRSGRRSVSLVTDLLIKANHRMNRNPLSRNG